MPKQYQGKKHFKVANDQAPNINQSNNENKEKSSSSKEKDNKNNHKYTKPKVDLLQHNGITSTNVHSWCHSLNNPEVFGSLDLKLTWSSSLFKEGTDAAKIKRPSLVGDEPVKPIPDANGKIDYFEERRYWKQVDKQDQRTAEERVVYDFTQSKQSPQSLAVCKQQPSYEEINRKQDIIEYLKIIYKTHLINVSNPVHAELNGLKKFVTFRQLDNQSTVDYFEAFRKMIEQVRQSVPKAMAPSEELEAWTLLMGMSSGHSQL